MAPGVRLPTAASLAEIGVDRALDGGVRVHIGSRGVVMSPADAIKFGSAVLRAAGCNLNFDGDPKTKKELRL